MKLQKILSAVLVGIFLLTFTGCGNNAEEVQKLIDTGVKQHNAGNDAAALNTFNEAIKLAPENSEAWANLGNCYNAMQNHDKAISTLNKAVDINPQNAFAWVCLGSSYNSKDNYDKAIECFERAMKNGNLSKSDNSSALAGIGVAYAKKGNSERALEYLQKATEIDSRNEYAWDNIEIVKKNLGKQ